jgi:phospholipase D-like protein
MAPKRGWGDLSPIQQKAVIAGGIGELVLTTRVLRDLARRPGDDVRGPKLLWVLACVVQPFGPLAYLAFGRRTR